MQSYQLHIRVKENIQIQVGKLGKCTFPRGHYIYTGSAKKNIDERIKRHKSNSPDKKLHWHIDYLLNNEHAEIFEVNKFDIDEFTLNQQTTGEVIIKGFGNSDYKNKSDSHLKYLG